VNGDIVVLLFDRPGVSQGTMYKKDRRLAKAINCEMRFTIQADEADTQKVE
jgi:hypothetical protein